MLRNGALLPTLSSVNGGERWHGQGPSINGPLIVSLGLGIYAWSVGMLGSVRSDSKTQPNIKASIPRALRLGGEEGEKVEGQAEAGKLYIIKVSDLHSQSQKSIVTISGRVGG